MRRAVILSIFILIATAQSAGAVGNSWNKIRYRGGTVQAKVNPYDWNTTLTVNPDSIVLAFAPRPVVRIMPSQVTSISYGREAQRRVADILATSVPGNPPGLFGLLRGKDCFVGIVYQTEDGKIGAVLLEVHKYYCLDVLQALKIVTGKPVEM